MHNVKKRHRKNMKLISIIYSHKAKLEIKRQGHRHQIIKSKYIFGAFIFTRRI